MKYRILLYSMTIMIGNMAFHPVKAQDCGCQDLLQNLINRVQLNYAGYIHKVRDTKDSSSYVQLKKKLVKQAATASLYTCYTVLNRYVDYFKDGHLFVLELPALTKPQSDSMRSLIKEVTISETQLKNSGQQKNADPIEGIWRDKDQQLAIIPNGRNKFLAVTIENKKKQWTPGMVKMEIEKTKPGEYFITLFRNDFAAIRFSKVRMYKNCILPFGVYRFARQTPVHPELKYININNPELPYYEKLDPKNILLTIPTALISRNVLDSVLMVHQKEILSTENLIIDIRGNGGGNGIWRTLVELANTKEYIQKDTADDFFLMLASGDNAEYIQNNMMPYFRNTGDTAGIAYYSKLILSMQNNTGKMTKFSFYDPKPDTGKRKVYEFPKQIILLTDRGTASAGEAFVLQMRSNSSKVKVYGDNTYGMIDYMNINTLKINCGNNTRYYYGYPTFFSPSVTTSPINPTGIRPDKYIPAGTKDWIEWVVTDIQATSK